MRETGKIENTFMKFIISNDSWTKILRLFLKLNCFTWTIGCFSFQSDQWNQWVIWTCYLPCVGLNHGRNRWLRLATVLHLTSFRGHDLAICRGGVGHCYELDRGDSMYANLWNVCTDEHDRVIISEGIDPILSHSHTHTYTPWRSEIHTVSANVNVCMRCVCTHWDTHAHKRPA